MEQIYVWFAASFLAGTLVGFVIAKATRREIAQPVPAQAEAAPTPQAYGDDTFWLLKKQDLSGSQKQILEFIESSTESTIQAVQEKFTKVPDRELFYRLEQIHLLGFIDKERRQDNVIYALTQAYRQAIRSLNDDKTVMLGPTR